jgi:hypothetical protein
MKFFNKRFLKSRFPIASSYDMKKLIIAAGLAPFLKAAFFGLAGTRKTSIRIGACELVWYSILAHL